MSQLLEWGGAYALLSLNVALTASAHNRSCLPQKRCLLSRKKKKATPKPPCMSRFLHPDLPPQFIDAGAGVRA